MFPMDRKVLTDNPVVIEYDSRKQRVTKKLPNAFKARSFYSQMFRQGRNPKVVSGNIK